MIKKYVFCIILVVFSGMLFAEVSENWYQGKPIKAIDFKGLDTVSRMDIDGVFTEYRGQLFSDQIYLEILEKLYELEYFNDIQINALPYDPEYKTVRLEFTVSELPSISGLKFSGNERIRSGELISKIMSKKESIYNEVKKRSDEQAIRAFYLEKGYAAVKVSSKKISNIEENTVVLEFLIEEGKQTVVSKILFEGNINSSDKQLKKILVTKEPRLLNPGIFKEEALEADKEAIKTFYGGLGYIDAHVENVTKNVDEKTDVQKNLVTITYTIMEGNRYSYGGTEIVGNQIFSSDKLLGYIRLKTGEAINMTKFKVGFEKIVDSYFENGYTSNSIDVKENRDESTKTIAFVIEIVERGRSHIENITIRGNTKTKEYVILRELLFESGDVFSKTKFMDSLRNLFNLRYFSNVIPDVQPGSEPDLLDITLNVEEQSTAKIQFGVTFSGVSSLDSFPLSLFLEWEESNLLGRGSGLKIKAVAGADEQSADFGYTENWFLGSPLTVGFNFSIKHKRPYAYQDVLFPVFSDADYDAMNGEIPPDPFTTWKEFKASTGVADAYRMRYNRLELSIGLNTGYRWFPPKAMITLRGGVDFSVVKNFFDTSLYRPVDPTTRNEQARWRLSNSLWLKASFDGRDVAHDPSLGWFVSEQVAFFGLIPKAEEEYFFRSETKTEAYVTLVDYPVSEVWNLKFVLAFYTGFTFQVPLTKKTIGPKSQLLIDGMFTGRGWNMLQDTGRGNVMLNHWIEFRWPLAHGILSFDFFFDAVAVKKSLKDLATLSVNDYYFSFGPGIRFSIPQFPLRLMFANTFRSKNGKPYWGNGKGADWRFVLSFSISNL